MSGSASRYPFTPYPDGWYHVAKSTELAAGDVRPIHYFGRDLVLFRTEGGEAVVFDAHCPHLGAHLGYGGCVVGESIRCPFHHWRFGRDGACVDVPYQTRGRLPAVGLARWPVDERSGLILVWHSDDGTSPSWHQRDIPEYEADDWLGYASRQWKIRMHVQELAENVPDQAHFETIHGVAGGPRADCKVDGPVFYQETSLPQEGADAFVFARQELYGLGLIWLRTPGTPEVFFVTATTPIDEEYCEVTQHMLVHDVEHRGELTPEIHAMLDGIFAQTDADVPIWENKVYREQPALVADDGPLPLLRSWARQFYPELR
jgi:nitrite reductase/ring-hydroxylating ferredoxin subunit